MKPPHLFAELKRRNVYRVAVAYAVVAWLLIQIATQTFPFFDIPNWAVRFIILLLALGFPIALILAWAFEVTPEGIQLTKEGQGDARPPTRTRRGIFWSLIAVGLIAGFFLSFHLVRQRTAIFGTSPAQGKRAVAVLPFDNLSDDKTNTYFADGMQDEIITRLAKVGGLKVISRTSTLPYKTKPEKLSEIARQLGVAHVVEGTVQRIADRVRINVQLIEAASDEHLWAELYDRNVADVFAVQTEVAMKIADSLRAKLSGHEQQMMAEKPTGNMAAYDAYLRGIDFDSRAGQTEEDQKKAIAALEEAVRLDPRFTNAWARMARVHANLYFLQIDASEARKQAARTAAETARRLDPAAPETLLANAYYRYHIERDYAGARELFEQIAHEMPSSSEATEALARIARRQSRWKESLQLYEQAAKLNPRDAHLFMDRAWTYSMLRRHAETLEMIDRALAITPGDPDVVENKVKALQSVGDLTGARAVLETRQGLPGRDPTAPNIEVSQFLLERNYPEAIRQLESKLTKTEVTQKFDRGGTRQFLGWIRVLAGDSAGAKEDFLAARPDLEIVQREQPGNPFVADTLALAEAGLGNKEAALGQAENATRLPSAVNDPVSGPFTEENLAAVEGMVGDLDRAIGRLERLLVTPYGAFPLTQAALRLDPTWDRLRAHPRFKALLEGPEPKTIYH
ncbi:MAG: tetratricopeptide repeat protein [Chthoniobacterales bacterium]